MSVKFSVRIKDQWMLLTVYCSCLGVLQSMHPSELSRTLSVSVEVSDNRLPASSASFPAELWKAVTLVHPTVLLLNSWTQQELLTLSQTPPRPCQQSQQQGSPATFVRGPGFFWNNTLGAGHWNKTFLKITFLTNIIWYLLFVCFSSSITEHFSLYLSGSEIWEFCFSGRFGGWGFHHRWCTVYLRWDIC